MGTVWSRLKMTLWKSLGQSRETRAQKQAPNEFIIDSSVNKLKLNFVSTRNLIYKFFANLKKLRKLFRVFFCDEIFLFIIYAQNRNECIWQRHTRVHKHILAEALDASSVEISMQRSKCEIFPCERKQETSDKKNITFEELFSSRNILLVRPGYYKSLATRKKNWWKSFFCFMKNHCNVNLGESNFFSSHNAQLRARAVYISNAFW